MVCEDERRVLRKLCRGPTDLCCIPQRSVVPRACFLALLAVVGGTPISADATSCDTAGNRLVAELGSASTITRWTSSLMQERSIVARIALPVDEVSDDTDSAAAAHAAYTAIPHAVSAESDNAPKHTLDTVMKRGLAAFVPRSIPRWPSMKPALTSLGSAAQRVVLLSFPDPHTWQPLWILLPLGVLLAILNLYLLYEWTGWSKPGHAACNRRSALRPALSREYPNLLEQASMPNSLHSCWPPPMPAPPSTAPFVATPRYSHIAPSRGGMYVRRQTTPNIGKAAPPYGRDISDKPVHEPLCPALIVPDCCECNLVVPIRPLTTPGLGPLSILDMQGNPVVRVVVHLQDSPLTMGSRPDVVLFGDKVAGMGRGCASPLMVLQTLEGEALAECHATPLGQFAFRRTDGEHYGTFSRGVQRDQYQLLMRDGAKLSFWGIVEQHEVSVTDNVGKLLAKTERCVVDFDKEGRYCSLRLASSTDVGLLLCGLLCVQILARAA